jgi:hypothetical protein
VGAWPVSKNAGLSKTVFDGEIMAIQNPISDLARSTQHDQDRSWPHEVKIEINWLHKSGRISNRSEVISADMFFGMGSFGAPLDGAALIGIIERLRREGPPKVVRKVRTKR